MAPAGAGAEEEAVDAASFVDESQYGFYAAFRGMFMLTDVGDATISPQPGTFAETDSRPEMHGGGSVVLGYRWSETLDLPLRTEVELIHRFRHDFDTTSTTPTTTIRYKNNLSTDQLMVNLLYDFELDSPWRPYVGGGVGVARHFSDVFRQDLTAGGDGVHNGNFDYNFAWSLQSGVMVRVAEDWAVEAGYRFNMLGDARSGVFPTGEQVTAENYMAHDFLLGIVYLF